MSRTNRPISQWLQKMQSHEAFQQRFSKQLDILLNAGLQIYQALGSIHQQEKQTIYKKVIYSIIKQIEKGKPFSYALEQNKLFFDDVFIELIKVGEYSGKIAEIVRQLSTYFDQKNDLKKNIITALTYPIIVILISFVSIVILLIVIVPNFEQMYAGFNAELPGPTKLVLSLSVFIQQYGLWIISVPIIAFILLKQSSYYVIVVNAFNRVLIKLPLLGEIYQNNLIIRFCLSTGLLLKNGVPLNQSIKQVIPLMGFEDFKKDLSLMITQLEKGISLKIIIPKIRSFPPLVTQLIMAGDESSQLAQSLEYIGQITQKEQAFRTQQLVTLIEPFLIVFLGITIGTIVVVLYLPIFELSNLY